MVMIIFLIFYSLRWLFKNQQLFKTLVNNVILITNITNVIANGFKA